MAWIGVPLHTEAYPAQDPTADLLYSTKIDTPARDINFYFPISIEIPFPFAFDA